MQDSLLEKANQAMRRGDAAGAAHLYREILKRNPKSAAAWASLGLLDLQAGRGAAALDAARRALALDPKNDQALGALSAVLYAQGRYAEAIAPLRALDGVRRGKDRRVLGSLAFALDKAGQTGAARAVARTLTRRFPNDSTAQMLRGDLAGRIAEKSKRREDFLEAQAAYQRAFTLDPSDPRPGINAAVSAEVLGDRAGAERLLKKVIAAHPESAAARLALGRLLYQRRAFAEAQAHLEAAIGRDPKNVDALVALGYALLLQGEAKAGAAAGYFRAARALAPGETRAVRGLAFLAEQEKRYRDAEELLQAILAREPGDEAVRRRLAASLEAQGKWSEASEVYRQALIRQPRDPELQVALGKALQKMGRDGDAARQFEAALAADPDGNAARWELAQAARKAGRDDDALAQMRQIRLRRGDPLRATYRLGPADLFRERGRSADERAELQRLMAEEPEGAAKDEVRYRLADVWEREGRTDDAERLLAELVQRARPEDLRPKTALAGLRERTGRLDDAGHGYEEMIARQPTTAAIDALRRVREKQGKRAAMYEFLEKVALPEGAAPVVAVLDAIERFSREDGTPEKAVALWRRAAERDPKNAEACVRQGRLLETLGRPDDAVRAYREAVRRDPASPAAARLRALEAGSVTTKTEN